MKKILRRIVGWSSLALFLLASPLVVFYSLGYRAGFEQSLAPQIVGVLSIESFPSRANVFLGGREIGRTPEIVSGLKPGAVDVVVTKPGYQQWRKRLIIEPGRATEAHSVLLFPESIHPDNLVPNAASFSLSPNRHLIAYSTQDHHVAVIDQSGLHIINPLPLSESVKSLLWSPNNTYVIITTISEKMFLLDTTRPNQASLEPLQLDAKKIVWDPRTPSRTLVQSQQGILGAYQITNRAFASLAENVLDFATSDRNLYVVTLSNQIEAYSFQGVPSALTIPAAPGVVQTLRSTPGGRLTIALDDGSLWVWDGHQEWQKITDKFQSFSWAPDEQMLMIASDSYSLYIYNFEADRAGIPLKELHLVTRLARPIHNPQWFAGSRHLIYQVEDEILVTEIDTRDYAQSYQLDTTNNGSSQVTVGESGRTIFYIRNQGSQNNLVSTSLLNEDTPATPLSKLNLLSL